MILTQLGLQARAPPRAIQALAFAAVSLSPSSNNLEVSL